MNNFTNRGNWLDVNTKRFLTKNFVNNVAWISGICYGGLKMYAQFNVG